MLRLLYISLILTVGVIANAQNLPEFKKDDNRKFYLGMYNDFEIQLNGADATMISIKGKDTQIKIANDSLYQVFLRGGDKDEVKLKLYYKSLPIDVYVLEIGQTPEVKVSVEGPVKSFYTIDELFDINLKFKLNDAVLNEDLSFSSFNTKIISANNATKPFISMNTPNFAQAKRLKSRLKSGDKILITDVRMKNRLNQSIMCQSNYIEFKIK